ncbi:MAG: glycosyltransferase family 2 protein [Mycobacteriales bacterium]
MRGETDLLAALLPQLGWADERHVVETAEDDAETRRVAGNANVHHHPLPQEASFEDARAAALPHIASDWVLVVDTDEVVTPSLARALRDRVDEWHGSGVAGVWLPRRNTVLDKPLAHSSAWPDYQLRMLRRDQLSYTPELHAPAVVTGTTERLPAADSCAIEHYPFRSTEQYLDKLNRYSSLEARQQGADPGASPARAAARAVRDFLARYVKMQGFRDGAVGLHYCVTMSAYRYLSEVKRWELQHVKSQEP